MNALPAERWEAVRKAARAELWRRRKVWPLLEVYLDRDQLEDARAILQGADVEAGELPQDDFCLDISRQRGKSWLCCTLAAVLCHCVPCFLVNYAAQEQKSVRQIVAPTFAAILEACPAELRPRFDRQDNVWLWDNGSRVRAFGCNNKQYTAGRGPRSHLNIKDECGFYDDYEAVDAVLAPQLQTTGGFTICASTPPETPSHPHSAVVTAHKLAGRYSHRTIYNHPRMSPAEVERFLAKEAAKKGMTLAAFKRTTYYLREFLAMHVVEETKAVVPEWSSPLDEDVPEGQSLGDSLVREVPRPRLFDTYSGADFGFRKHPSAILYAYWHWEAGALVVEDESPPLYRTRTDALAAAYRQQAAALWPTSAPKPFLEAKPDREGKYWEPWRAIGDQSGRGAEVLEDLAKEHHLAWTPANKSDNLEVRVNNLRKLVAEGKLWVHPRCKHLRHQLATGLWADKSKADFAEDAAGHLDHLAALVDLACSVDRQRNPYPLGFGSNPRDDVVHDWHRPAQSACVLEEAFG